MVQKLLPAACVFLWLCLLPGANGIILDTNFTDVTLQCDPSGVILSVNATALAEAIPSLDVNTVRVGVGPWLDQCRPREDMDAPSGIRIFRFHYGDCHPRVEELSDTKIRLTYDVMGEIPERGEGDLTPEGTSASCMVPKDGLIRARMHENTNLYEYVGNSNGPFQFGMTIYKDSFMTVPVAQNEDIPLGVPLWVGIKLNTTGSSEMFVRDCWATPNPTNSAEQPEHIFIKNGIIGEDDETFSPSDDVHTATTYGFSFDSFMFRGEGARVYVKCNVHVCDPYDVDSTEETGCSVPKYPEFHITARDLGLTGSGSGSGFGLVMNTRELKEQTRDVGDENEDEDEDNDNGQDENKDDTVDGGSDDGSNEAEVEKREVNIERPTFYIMNSFGVKHLERKRRSAGSLRVYPRHTMFSNLRSGIMLGIIIVSTAMFSACAILLPLHLSGEKVRCLHVKPVKRTV